MSLMDRHVKFTINFNLHEGFCFPLQDLIPCSIVDDTVQYCALAHQLMSVKSSFVLCQQRYGVLGSLLYLVVFPFLVRVGTHGLVGWQFGYVSFAPGFPKHIVQVKTFLLKTRYHLNATVFLDHTYKYFSNFICHNNSRVIAYIQLCRTVGMLTRPER